MMTLVTHFWAWWLAAVAVGAATSSTIRRRPDRGRVAGWLIWFAFAFVAGLPVAWLELLAGRPGLWLETGLALFAAFILGAALGALLMRRSLRDHEGWALGLIPLAVVWWGADTFAGRRLEQDIRRAAASAIESVGGDPLSVDVAGRDVLLPHDTANRQDLVTEIARVVGVRRVAEGEAPSIIAGRTEHSLAARRISPGAERESTPPADSADTAVPSPVPKPAPAAPSTEKKPPETSASNSGGARDSTPHPAGEPEAAACQAALSSTLAREPIQFRRGSAAVRRVSTGVLERVIVELKRCPRAKVEVRGYGDPGEGDGARLARERAERVVDYLARMGVERRRLVAVGQAESGTTNESRLIEFVVEQRG